jgi:hypothetical protein
VSSQPDPVRITLDLPELLPEEEVLTLVAGQEIHGSVEIGVLEEVAFRDAQVRLVWRTEGRGNHVSGTGAALALTGEGEWKAGSTHRFPFRLRAPWGPITYRGRILSIGWEMEARLDRSMLRPDVRAAIPVDLLGSPDPMGVNLGPREQRRRELEARKRGLGGVWLALSALFFLGIVLLGVARNWEFGGPDRWLVLLLMVGAFLLMVRGVWGRVGRGKLGEPVVQLSTTELRRGEEIRFHVGIRPDQRTELRTLEAILECEERVVQGHGQYQSRHRRTVYERRLLLAEDQVIEAHRGLRRKGTLTIPAEGPPSFGAPDNQVVWWLRFQGDIVGWPDWNEPFLLTVSP